MSRFAEHSAAHSAVILSHVKVREPPLWNRPLRLQCACTAPEHLLKCRIWLGKSRGGSKSSAFSDAGDADASDLGQQL